ncbi:hypothetical protein WB44_00705 [Synechococcus sp. WH 8020]|nr:hypothetical protein WB44_00705 [Synechococcus sp. WH 8020]
MYQQHQHQCGEQHTQGLSSRAPFSNQEGGSSHQHSANNRWLPARQGKENSHGTSSSRQSQEHVNPARQGKRGS